MNRLIRTTETGQSQFGHAFDMHDQRAAENTIKVSAHPHDRIEERTSFHRSHVDIIQRAVDTLGLPKGSYHLPLRDQKGKVLGFAQFKGVENRKAPVLATVLGPQMKPGGTNIEQMIKLNGFIEKNEAPETLATPERPGQQATQASTLRRAFGNMTQGTGHAVEQSREG